MAGSSVPTAADSEPQSAARTAVASIGVAVLETFGQRLIVAVAFAADFAVALLQVCLIGHLSAALRTTSSADLQHYGWILERLHLLGGAVTLVLLLAIDVRRTLQRMW